MTAVLAPLLAMWCVEAGDVQARRRPRVAGGAPGAKLPTAIVLDIEGTVAAISYVTEVLFPYSQQRLRSHLEATFDSPQVWGGGVAPSFQVAPALLALQLLVGLASSFAPTGAQQGPVAAVAPGDLTHTSVCWCTPADASGHQPVAPPG